MFNNRIEAGLKLAEKLLEFDNISNGMVIAVPRGGVVVGAQVAKKLKIPLDIIIPKKVGSPFNPEVAIGAVTEDGTAIYNYKLLNVLGLQEEDMEAATCDIINEIKRRMVEYRGTTNPPDLTDKDVILVDDGIATGSTIIAALRSIKNSHCANVILAVPVAPPDVLECLKEEIDTIVCLISEEPFYAVGQFYGNFSQVSDAEVKKLLNK
jgi:putative phosphoribosyl transferase